MENSSLEEVMEKLCANLDIPVTYDVEKLANEAVKKGATSEWTPDYYAKLAGLTQTVL